MDGRSALQPVDYYNFRHGGNAPLGTLQERQLVSIEMLRSATSGTDGRLLDVGCGDGLFLSALDGSLGLSERGWQLCGVDYSGAMLEQARQRSYDFEQCNLEEGLAFDDSTFDVITAGEVLEHLYDPDLLVAEGHRALRPEGSMLITTPNLHAWYNRILFLLGIQPLYYETSTQSPLVGAGPLRRIKRGTVPVGHVRIFNRQALFDLIERQGFEVTATRGAVFEAIPRPIRTVDRIFNVRPALASNLIVLATRARR